MKKMNPPSERGRIATLPSAIPRTRSEATGNERNRVAAAGGLEAELVEVLRSVDCMLRG